MGRPSFLVAVRVYHSGEGTPSLFTASLGRDRISSAIPEQKLVQRVQLRTPPVTATAPLRPVHRRCPVLAIPSHSVWCISPQTVCQWSIARPPLQSSTAQGPEGSRPVSRRPYLMRPAHEFQCAALDGRHPE